MLGAMAAAREDRHIGLDIAARWLPGPMARAARGLVHLFAAAVSAVLAWQAWRMLRDEFALGGNAFGDVPSWVVQAILPLALAVIALRLAIAAFRPPARADAGPPGH
jgi:TRAP-type C4-dicarboxylate transport system permease small subunit